MSKEKLDPETRAIRWNRIKQVASKSAYIHSIAHKDAVARAIKGDTKSPQWKKAYNTAMIHLNKAGQARDMVRAYAPGTTPEEKKAALKHSRGWAKMKRVKWEAVDPEDRAVRLNKIKKYMLRNKGALDMSSTANPHAQTHYHSRFAQAEQILRMKRVDKMIGKRGAQRNGSSSRVIGLPGRLARMDLRKAQAKATKKAAKKGVAIVPFAADKLTSTEAWKRFRRSKGMPE